MNNKTKAVIAAEKQKKSFETVRNFDSQALKAPFILRCGAVLIDYFVAAIFPVGALLLGRFMGDDGAKLMNSELTNAGWLLAGLVTILNFIIFPLLNGKTIGKMMTGIRVVNINGTTPKLSNLIVRHLIGYPITALSLGLGFLLVAFNKNGRALHDLFSKTMVVYGNYRKNN